MSTRLAAMFGSLFSLAKEILVTGRSLGIHRANSSAVEHSLHTRGVVGSKPTSPIFSSRSTCGPCRLTRLVESQRQTFRRATRLQKFRKLRFDEREPGGVQPLAQQLARFVHDYGRSDGNRIACEMQCVIFFERDAQLARHETLDQPIRFRI